MRKTKIILAIMVIVALCVGSVVLAEEAATVTAHDYLGEWVDQDGTTNIDITARDEGDGYIVNVQMNVEGEDDVFTYVVWAYGCVYDEETHAMKSISRVTGTGDYEPDSEEQIDDTDFEYADAEFCFDDAGKLVWNDANLSEDEGKLFEHTYGWKDPDYVGPGHHFVGEWNDERVTVYIEETMEDYQVAVVGSGSATDGAIWTYTCDYDAETDSLVSNGEVATKVNYTYVDAENSTEELVYKDGEAVFSLNGEGLLVWDDKKEQAGEGRAFALVTAEATEEESSEKELQVTGRTVEPMVPEYDLDALADGVYPVYFDPANLADGTLSLTVYSQDVFDIVDISTLEAGDSLVVNGIPFVIETLERDDGDLLINGGLDNGGLTLRAFDEDNCWKAVMEDDQNTYTERGDATLPLADDVTFTDGWDIEKDPVTVSGAEAVADAITGTDMNYFSPLNTTVRVEGGKIVEIVRAYMP